MSLNMTLAASLMVAGCDTVPKPGFEHSPSLFEQLVRTETPKDLLQPASYRPDTSGPSYSEDGKFLSFPGEDVALRPTAPASGAGVEKDRNGYQLNFNNVELAELTQAILRDTLQATYIFDPKIRGNVTVSTNGSVSRDELLTILETVLDMNRAVLIKNGNQYAVSALATEQSGTTTGVDYVTESDAVGPGYGISFFPLRHVSASTMIRTLGSFAASQRAMRAAVHKNILMIRGTGPERKALVEIASSLDVDWLRGQSVGLFRLDNSKPFEVIGELEKIFNTETGGLGRGMVRFQPIDRLNAILVISSKSSMLEKAETWVRRLDRTDPAAETVHVYQVENGNAKTLAPLLTEMFVKAGGGGSRMQSTDTISPSSEPSMLASASSSSDADGPSGAASSTPGNVGSSSSGTSDSFFEPRASASRALGSTGAPSGFSASNGRAEGVMITPDEVNNRLLIRANGHDYRLILDMLRQLDQPTKQVLINATIAEVRLNGNLRYGVQVFLRNQGLGAVGFSNGSLLQIQPPLPGMNILTGNIASPKVILDALSSHTDVRLVSSPSVVATNNQPASIQVGDDVPVAIGRSQQVTDESAPIVQEIQYRKTGVILNVTPSINSDGLVTLDVEQEISNVVQSQVRDLDDDSSGGSNVTPTISQRRVSSRIGVYSGQMVVLGGLMSESKESAKNRVPYLERVPVLGDILGSTNTDSVRTELVIFIQPHVINDPRDATLIADELKDRLLHMAPAYDRRERHDLHRAEQPIEEVKWTAEVSYK